MKRITLISGFVMLGLGFSFSQNTAKDSILKFSVKEAQEYAVKNSYKTSNADKDITIAKKKVAQTTAIGLPQISGSAKYQNYIDIPVQLMPDFLTPAVEGVLVGHNLITAQEMTAATGNKFAIQFGSKNNFTADITATQLIFDGSYIVGLQAAKTFVEISKNAYTKSEIDVKESVAQSYYLVLVALENRNILDSTLTNIKKSLNDSKKYLENGFIEETDVDQFEILVSTMENKLNMVDRQIEIAYKLLKFQMGIDLDKKIELTEDLDNLVGTSIAENLSSKTFDIKNHIDFKLLQTQEQIGILSLRKDKFGYIPSMACFITTSRNAQRNEFDFLDKGKEWYRTTIFGVSLTVPIWDSGIKHYKIQQDKIELEKTKVLQTQLAQALTLDVESSRSTLETYTEQYANDQKNMKLAKKIYDKTLLKYNEGLSTSLELTQAYNQYLTAQGTYFSTVLELLKAKSTLNKALNNY
jgi:outer membrane protein